MPLDMPDSDDNSRSRQRIQMPRYPSFSKRHASFNSPREVPLPSPVLTHQDAQNPFFTGPSTTPPHSPSSSSSRPRSPSSPTQRASLGQDDVLYPRRHRHTHSSSASAAALTPQVASSRSGMRSQEASSSDTPDPPPPDQATVHPSSRPLSIPDSQSSSYASSLASLFRKTPPQSPTSALRSTTWIDRNSSASLPLPLQVPFYALPKAQLAPSSSNMHRRVTESNLDQSRGFDAQGVIGGSESDRSGLRCPSLDGSGSSSSSSSSSGSSISFDSNEASANSTPNSEIPPFPSNNKGSSLPPVPAPIPRPISRTPQRPVSPFRAPQPPEPEPPNLQMAHPTAMSRFMTPAQQENLIPAPEPPIVLEAQTSDDASLLSSASAPYASFLSHAPAPEDCWLQIETTQAAYRLHVHLPGFTREGITLATKRRRILHVVADKWENGGGHFERRVSFGYDADLVQVRAEFDGWMLRIIIPRRITPIFF